MSLADALSKERNLLPGPRCTTCQLVDRLDDADRAALAMAMQDESVTTTTITRALNSEGHSISSESVRRHRRGECAKR